MARDPITGRFVAGKGPEVVDKDKGFKRFARGMRARGGPSLLIGIQGKEALEDHGGIPNVAIAAINEFGKPDNRLFGKPAPIPARPVLRQTFDREQRKWLRLASAAIRARAADTLSIQLARVGEVATADIKNAIAAGVGDPPSATTLALRRREGFAGTKQLVRTSQLKNSITYKVKGR